MTEKANDVVIVGAGMAGLAAADQLYRNGISDFVILEASARYGGRLYTLPYGDAYLEMGANWIHGGSEENDLFDVAARRSLLDVQSLLLEDRAEGLFYTSQGQSIDSQLGVKCYQMFFDAELEAGRLYRSDARMKQRLASKSLLQFLEDEWIRLADEAFGPDGPNRPNADAIFQSMLLYFRSHVGNDLSLVPAVLHGTFENLAGEDVKMPNGMRALVDQFYVNLPKGSVQFDTTVTGIFWDEGHDDKKQGAADSWLDHPVKITTDCGLVWKAKHVICTLPLGVLKRSHDKIFHPPLPPLKVKAINGLGFGKVEKVFLVFDQPFWTPGFGGVKLAWTAKDLQEKLLPRDWYKVICSFEEVFRQPNVLAAWVSGSEAQAMLSLDDEQILSTCTELLRTFTNNPGMAPPVRVIRSNWLNSPLSYGSYSFPTFESSHRSFNDLASPLPSDNEPRLQFAGEATHDNYYSTLHAAFLSGRREADRILPMLQPNKHSLKHKL